MRKLRKKIFGCAPAHTVYLGPGRKEFHPKKPRPGMPTLPVSSRAGNQGEVTLGFSRDEAKEEASRCLSCGCQICIKALACPAIVIADDEVIIDDTLCPGCGVCAQVCPKEAILQNGRPQA